MYAGGRLDLRYLGVARGGVDRRVIPRRIPSHILRHVALDVEDKFSTSASSRQSVRTTYIPRPRLVVGEWRIHFAGFKGLVNNTHAPFARRTLRQVNPAGHILRPTRTRSALRKSLDYVGET